MNALSTITEPLGWALLHFLWQGAAIGVLLRVFLWLARRSAPQVRYAAAGVALLLMLSAAAGTLWWQARGVEVRAQRTEKTTGTEATPQVVQSTSSFESTQSFPSLPPPTAADCRSGAHSRAAPVRSTGHGARARRGRAPASSAAVAGERMGRRRGPLFPAIAQWLAHRAPLARVRQ